MVLQYALCNPWDYFFTGTIDRTKFNRFDLATYQSRLSQFIRDKRKKYHSQIQFLLVPEHHIFVAKEYFRAAARAAAGEYLSTMILCSM